MDVKKIYAVLEKTGALKKGHFKLSSGFHSENYLQCALVLQHPQYAEFFGRELARKLKDVKIDIVISPAVGGVIIGQEVAKALGERHVRAIFAERVDGKFTLRRGFEIKSGEKVIVVEDVITTGGSSLAVANMAEEMGGEVIGFAAIGDRSSRKIAFNKPFYNLLRFDFKNYPPEECPLCQKKIPLNTPGSRYNK